jgi:hypothetical protein
MFFKKKRKFALYIGLGIEANNFMLSGLSTKLKEVGDVTVLANYDSPILDKLLMAYDVNKKNISDLKISDFLFNVKSIIIGRKIHEL